LFLPFKIKENIQKSSTVILKEKDKAFDIFIKTFVFLKSFFLTVLCVFTYDKLLLGTSSLYVNLFFKYK